MTVIPPESGTSSPRHYFCKLPRLMPHETLWQCPVCQKWWLSRCSALTNYEYGEWIRVRWYHRDEKRRIRDHQVSESEATP